MRIILNKSIWSTDGTLTGTATSGESQSESNGDEEGSIHSPDLQNWSITTRITFLVKVGSHLSVNDAVGAF